MKNYEKEILPKGWNKELEIIFEYQMDDYLSGYSNYYPTREKVILEIQKELVSEYKNIDLDDIEEEDIRKDFQAGMSKEEVIKIIDDSLDELLDEVGNDYEYNGCSHLVKIIIDKINFK